uniref:P-type conjugative transfer protein TrbL n=1 Tax=Elaeophora elaphi TaxID=1147741 RepID=A0A0R3S316_9BILA
MYAIVTVIIFLAGQVNGQYSELASLVGGVLTPGIASGASGLLGNIGTLYQIAQGALQLTGTGVGILNQASEGKWFNSVLEQARSASFFSFSFLASLKREK